MKMLNKQDKFFTIPRFEQIPYLVHGFGTGQWKESDFKKIPEVKNFKLLFLNQVHSNVIHFIEKIPSKNLKGDAMITALPTLLLVVKTADCLPVLIVEESRKIIAVVHCGWRGTQQRVIQRTIKGMEDCCGCQASSLLVAFGPCIGNDCYEVGEEVRQSFKKADLPLDVFRSHSLHKAKYLLDLREANLYQLHSLGVKKENIFAIDFCSHCCDSLPSFRREGKRAARMLNFIGKLF